MPAQFHDLWWRRPCQVFLLLVLDTAAVAVAQKKSGVLNVVYMDDISCATMSNYLTIYLTLSLPIHIYICVYASMIN